MKSAINAALEAGYRHIDTAYNYMNEDAIGEVLHEWLQSGKVKREEVRRGGRLDNYKTPKPKNE